MAAPNGCRKACTLKRLGARLLICVVPLLKR